MTREVRATGGGAAGGGGGGGGAGVLQAAKASPAAKIAAKVAEYRAR